MRLLKSGPYAPGKLEFQLASFPENRVPQYAILSHVWIKPETALHSVHSEEVEFVDVQAEPNPRLLGRHKHVSSRKLEGVLRQAQLDGWGYVWADTTCIDKTSSSELSEAINSMFAWYRDAAVCYAYLADVPDNTDLDSPFSAFAKSEWWERGWTLQELLAPKTVMFFSRNWALIGTKNTLADKIAGITGVDADFLTSCRPLDSASIAKRFSWAATRKTTRSEDKAYCLMGLFDLSMPMLYGEGARAFKRLQEEIVKQSDDQSIFAWAKPPGTDSEAPHGLLADAPSDFNGAGDKFCFHDWEERAPYVMTNRGLSIELHLIRMEPDLYVAALHCPAPPEYNGFLAIWLRRLQEDDNQYVRVKCDRFGSLPERGRLSKIFVRQRIPRSDEHKVYPNQLFLLRHCEAACNEYQVIDVVLKASTSAELHHMPHLAQHARKWMPKEFPVSFECHNGSKQLSAALLLRRRRDKEDLVLLVGSLERFGVGFEVREEAALGGMAAMEKTFEPQLSGTAMSLRRHQVKVDAETVVEGGKVMHVVDIDIESIPSDSSRQRGESEGTLGVPQPVNDQKSLPQPSKNRKSLLEILSL